MKYTIKPEVGKAYMCLDGAERIVEAVLRGQVILRNYAERKSRTVALEDFSRSVFDPAVQAQTQAQVTTHAAGMGEKL